MPPISVHSVAKESKGTFPLLQRYALVTRERVAVGQGGIGLGGTFEAPQGIGVILEMGEDIAGRNPGLSAQGR